MLEQERWSRVKEVLGTALELPMSQRSSYLDRTCGADAELREEVETLIAASDDIDHDFIETPALAQSDEWLSGLIGSRIGPYRIAALLGEGGMGAVYRGVRDDGDFQQQIAIKLVKRGMDTQSILRRFRAERRILARLDHPNICKLLDGGVTEDGMPYFVMEYLQGTPIKEYCEQECLSLHARLHLFMQLCSAVEYSHRNLVVHRDLKAKNILITQDGVPKLLDFGIAKLLDRDSSTGGGMDPTVLADRLFTPDYASPEQIRGESITTAADIYSLGVLLYEILTGKRPLQLTGLHPAELARMISEEEPPKPSSVASPELARGLVGDIDTIVAKAMHKLPERRYGSAAALADDLKRYIEGKPVQARGDTFTYRAGKFLRRNRASVIVATLAAIGAFGGLFAAVWQHGVAATKEREARKRFGDVRELANSFLGELDTELERLSGSTAAREILARKVLHYLDQLAKEEVHDRALQREMAVAYERLGDVEGAPLVSNLGNTKQALEAYQKAIAVFDQLAAERPNDQELTRDRSRAYSKMSGVRSMVGDLQGALAWESKSRDVRLDWLAKHPEDRAIQRALGANLQNIAGYLDQLGRYPEALQTRHQALRMIEELNRNGPVDTNLRLALALANKRLGRSLHRSKRYDEAIPYYLRALEIEKEEVQRDPSKMNSRVNLSFTWNDMGNTHFARGDYPKAQECYSEALRVRAELVRENPKDVRSASMLANSRLHLGLTMLKLGRTGAGLPMLVESLHERERLSEKDPQNSGALAEVAEACAALGDANLSLKRPATARNFYQRAYEIYSGLRDQGKLTADFRAEPDRLSAALDKIKSGSS